MASAVGRDLLALFTVAAPPGQTGEETMLDANASIYLREPFAVTAVLAGGSSDVSSGRRLLFNFRSGAAAMALHSCCHAACLASCPLLDVHTSLLLLAGPPRGA